MSDKTSQPVRQPYREATVGSEGGGKGGATPLGGQQGAEQAPAMGSPYANSGLARFAGVGGFHPFTANPYAPPSFSPQYQMQAMQAAGGLLNGTPPGRAWSGAPGSGGAINSSGSNGAGLPPSYTTPNADGSYNNPPGYTGGASGFWSPGVGRAVGGLLGALSPIPYGAAIGSQLGNYLGSNSPPTPQTQPYSDARNGTWSPSYTPSTYGTSEGE